MNGHIGGGSFKVASPLTDQHPDAMTPLSLIVFSVLCIGWCLWTLGRAIWIQLAVNHMTPYSAPRLALLALFGFVLPALTANAILMNWRTSRWLVIVLVAGNIGLTFYELAEDGAAVAAMTGTWVVGGAAVFLLLWLFVSPAVSAHFARLGGATLSPEQDAATAITPRTEAIGRALSGFGRLAEWVAAVLIGVAFYLLGQMRFGS